MTKRDKRILIVATWLAWTFMIYPCFMHYQRLLELRGFIYPRPESSEVLFELTCVIVGITLLCSLLTALIHYGTTSEQPP